jgi:hypothetical protein
MKKLLIAHHKRDISWVSKINKDIDISIYSTSDRTKNYTNNKGMDSSMYLKYIIDNYNNLPDKTLFVHHHEYDWTQDFNLPFIINNLKWNCSDYFSICARKNYNDVFIIAPQTKELLKNNWFLFEKYIPYPEQLIYYAGTQFCVSKDLLKQYPIEYWVYLFNWVQNVDMDDGIVGRIFEWCWHYILTKNPIEKKRDIKEIINI